MNKLSKEQDERRHRLAGLAVDSILKGSSIRRSADNITAVTITFDNFYRMLDEAKGKCQSNVLDFDIIELQNLKPIPVVSLSRENQNVIYIENDDVLEDTSDLD